MSYAVYAMNDFHDHVGNLIGFYSGANAYDWATTAAGIAMLTHDLVEIREITIKAIQEN